MTAYRDAEEAARTQLRALVEALRERESRATSHFWRNLPPALAEEYGSLRARCAPRSDAPDALAEAREAAAACVATLDRALALLPEMERAWGEAPEEAPPVPWETGFSTTSLMRDASRCEQHARELVEAVRRHDDTARLVERSPIAYEVTARVGGAPLRFAIELPMYELARTAGAADVVTQCTTALCRAVEPLRLRSEGWLDGLLKVGRVRRDVQLGDVDFDAMFFVEGDPAASRAMLSPEARAALMVIARYDVPVVSASPGVAHVRWAYEPRGDMIDAAVRLLLALRAAPPTLKLRTG